MRCTNVHFVVLLSSRCPADQLTYQLPHHTYLLQNVYRTFSMAWWSNHLLFFAENTQEMTALAKAWEFLQSYHAKDVELERLCLWSHCSYQQAQDMVTPPRLAVSREKYLLIMKGSTFWYFNILFVYYVFDCVRQEARANNKKGYEFAPSAKYLELEPLKFEVVQRNSFPSVQAQPWSNTK